MQEGGASWGMDLDGEDEVQAYQRKCDKEDMEEGSGLSGSEDEMGRVLDIEKLKTKSEKLSDKQNKLVLKIDGMRRKIHKMMTNSKGKDDSKV